MRNIQGRIHSKESFGAVDGPGIRFVVFLQGCPLQCAYCHNRDAWGAGDSSQDVWSKDLLEEILTYRNFIHHGGVTFSGGEPLLQSEFCLAMTQGLKENGIHVAIDTSGIMPLEKIKSVIDLCDLILLDIKAFDDEICKELTGASNKNALRLLNYAQKINRTVWIRHVLVPGYTLKKELLERMADYLKNYSCIEKVELLPFHKMGEYKWEGLGYRLKNTPVPTQEEVVMAKNIFLTRGFSVI